MEEKTLDELMNMFSEVEKKEKKYISENWFDSIEEMKNDKTLRFYDRLKNDIKSEILRRK